ncbi:hypothetical protein HWI79_334 [Cryptosporidium felis]|nr:hypothetical protein HWI79_334 [Cryptosporidium felis]
MASLTSNFGENSGVQFVTNELEQKGNRSQESSKPELSLEDDTSIADDDDSSSDYQSIIDSFKFERGLSLELDIPKETIKYIYNEKLEKHVQLPNIVSFRDLCIEAFGEENVSEKRQKDDGRKKWDRLLNEKSITGDSFSNEEFNEDMENKYNEERENEESERTYEDITSFLDTIKSNNKQGSQNVNENALRKRVHEMSTRLSKQGLLCDPRDYYFNPMTMTGGNGINRSREDYYDVFDDFIDDTELVDDLGLSLDELYSRNKVKGSQEIGQDDDSVITTSVQTSELIYADYSNPNAFCCDDDPKNDLLDLYYESESEEDGQYRYESELGDSDVEFDTKVDEPEASPKKKSLTLRDIINDPVLKLLVQLRVDCWTYYSPKNMQLAKEQGQDQNSQNSIFPQSSTPVSDLASGIPLSQTTVELATPVTKVNKEFNQGSYPFPQRTPRVVSDWFRSLNQKIKQLGSAYQQCKSYYNTNGNIKYEKGIQHPEITDSLVLLKNNIEKDPILSRISSLFSDIYPNSSDVAPFDSKLIKIIWEGLNICIPINNKKKQFNLSHNSSSSSAISQLLMRFDNFKTKWARLILNHNQEAHYQFDLNAFEAITNFPPIKNKSPEYVKRVLDSINQYNQSINNCGKDKDEKHDDKMEGVQEISNTPILIYNSSQFEDANVEETKSEVQENAQSDFTCDKHFGASDSLGNADFVDSPVIAVAQNTMATEIPDKKKPIKSQDSITQGIRAVCCDLVFDFGISLLEYVHGINRLRLVYKDMISANVITKSIQKEQENIPANGSKGLEAMIKGHILKRFSNVSYEGQKIKEIPHRFFLNQIRLLQIKYSYKSLTSISVRKPKNEMDPKSKKRQRKDNVITSTEKTSSSNKLINTEKHKKAKENDVGMRNNHAGDSLAQVDLATQQNNNSESTHQPTQDHPSSSIKIENRTQKPKKSKKTTFIEDQNSVVSSEFTENSQEYLIGTPHLDFQVNGSLLFSETSHSGTLQNDFQEGTKIVERELCETEMMASHTVQEN